MFCRRYIACENMITYHEELMKFIYPSWPTTYTIEKISSNSNGIKELRLSDDLKDTLIAELGRISYKSSGASVYIPKRIVKALHLNKEENRTLVILSLDDYGFVLIKDTALAQRLKLQILNLRKNLDENARAVNSM